MKSYEVAAQQSQIDDDIVSFRLNGREIKTYVPNTGDFAVVMSQLTGHGVSELEQVGATVDFFFELLVEEKDRRYLWKRLKDRKDKFGMEQIEKIFEDLMEEWSARPTGPSSGSTQQPQEATRSSSSDTPISI